MFAPLPLFPTTVTAPLRSAPSQLEADDIARDLTHALDAIFGPSGSQYDPALDHAALTKDLASFLAIPPIVGAEADIAACLVSFNHELAAKHPLAPSTWTLLLDRAASHPALSRHPLSLIATQLGAAMPRLPYLRDLRVFFTALPGSSETVAMAESALVLHALLAAAPASDLALRLAAAIDPGEALRIDSLDTVEASLVSCLRDRREQTGVDEALAGLSWLRRLRAAASIHCGADALLDAAVRCSLVPEGTPPAVIFRLRLVGHHGLHQASTYASLTEQSTATSAALPASLSLARPALRSLSVIARDLAEWPETLRFAVGREPAAAQIANILVEEHRLRRPAAARAAAFRRIAVEKAPGKPISLLSALPAALNHLGALPEWKNGEPAVALDALRAALPVLEAASALLESHFAIGADTARRAYAAQPDYAAKTGPSGEKACAKDNGLTLRQLALLLLDGQPQPAERLQDWWSATVGVHIVNRPPHLFVQNLRALHAALRHALPPAGLDAVFPALHQLYKEAIGVPDSPFLYFGSYPLPVRQTIDREVLANPVFRKTHLKRVSALACDATAFAADWIGWLDAPCAAGLANLARAHGADSVLRAASLLLGDVLRNGPGSAHPTTREIAALPERLALALLADHLEKPRPEASNCERDLALTHAFFGEQLRLRPLDSAVLQSLRFLIELVGPHLVEGAEEWEKNVRASRSALIEDCPDLARPVLERWFSLLLVVGPRLVAFRPFLQLAYPVGHPALDRGGREEKTLRGALTCILLPELVPASAPWSGARLAALASAVDAGQRERLVAFLDTLFDQLDGANYYDLLTLLGEPAARPTVEPEIVFPSDNSPRLAALLAPPKKSGLLGGLFGPAATDLAHDLANAAALSPAWLAPVMPNLAAEAVRPQVWSRFETIVALAA
jgi:hypothetical protein